MSRVSGETWCAHHFFYGGNLDVALTHFVRPVLVKLLGDQLIDSFFFVRYTFGGPHLRLRLRLNPDRPESFAAAAVDMILKNSAARFFDSCPSPASSVPIRRQRESSAGRSEVFPEAFESTAPCNSLSSHEFEPEIERYGGEKLLPHSLDFFAVSSARVLEIVTVHQQEALGLRLAIAMRLLLHQVLGFSDSEKELVAYLSYRLPVGEGVVDVLYQRADRVFEARRDQYRGLFLHELEILSKFERRREEPLCLSPAAYAVASKRFSQEIREAEPEARWQIGTSQMHMTANRLGLSSYEEMYLDRILWRTARDVRKSNLATRFLAQIFGSPIACTEASGWLDAPLRELHDPLIRHLLFQRYSSPESVYSTG